MSKMKLQTNLILIFLSLFAGVLIAHYIHATYFFGELRAFEGYAYEDAYTQYPFIGFKGPINKGGYNELGYIGPVPSLDRDDTYRVFVVGGSTVIGGHMSVVPLLEGYFHKEGYKKVRVYNFGAISSSSGQGLARLVFEILDFHPNLVIFYNGGNDILDRTFGDPRPGYPFNFFISEANPIYIKDLLSYPIIPLILYRSSILREYFHNFFLYRLTNINVLRKGFKIQPERWKKQVAASYLKNMERAAKVAKGVGVDFVGAFQPMLYYKKSLSDEERLLGGVSEGDFAKSVRGIILQERHRYKHLDLLDLSSMFDDREEQVYVDSIHLKDEYQKYVALELFKVSLPIVRRHFKQ